MRIKTFNQPKPRIVGGNITASFVEHDDRMRGVLMVVRGEDLVSGAFRVATVTMDATEARALAAQLLKAAEDADVKK